jgi:hypothetical protein
MLQRSQETPNRTGRISLMVEEDASPTRTEDKSPPSGGRTAAELRVIADALRGRVDLFGKTLAAVATLGTTAVGLQKIGDLFPTEGSGSEAWAAAACIGLAAAALAAIGVAVRLMRVARPVFISADSAQSGLKDEDEKSAVRPVVGEAAQRFGYSSMAGLREYESSLRTTASTMADAAEHDRQIELADAVKTEIEQALARSQVVVVRQRADHAVYGFWAWFCYVVFICGLLAFAAGTDAVSSQRKEHAIALAKSCGEARKAGALDAELTSAKGICVAKGSSEPPKPQSIDEARTQLAAALTKTLKACAALVHKQGDAASGPLTKKDCEPVRSAAAAMLPLP